MKLLEKLFEVNTDDPSSNQLASLEVINAELVGYCTDADQQVYAKMFQDFASKFNTFIELRPLTLSSVCDQEQMSG